MPSTARRALAASLIALHAAIMLCGPGLHAAPGLGHSQTARDLSRPDTAPSLATASTSPGEHCPLCDFFAQGQLPTEPASPVTDRIAGPAGPTALPVSPPRPPLLSTRSRAPPVLDTLIVPPTTSGSKSILG